MDIRWLKPGEDARELARAEVEVWAPCFEAPDYAASNMGRLLSFRRGRPYLLRVAAKVNKYPGVSLYKDATQKSPHTLVHRIVLLAFDGPPPAGCTDGRHINGNVHDARLPNLAWGTRQENMRDVWGPAATIAPGREVTGFGLPAPETNASRTLTEEQAQTGIRMFERGAVSVPELAGVWGVTPDVAQRILLGETTWPHLERDAATIRALIGRTGDAHHRVKVYDDDLAAALAMYVEHRWSGVMFARHLGISQLVAHSILSGRTRTGVPRPAGFAYPWPDARSMNKLTGEKHGCALVTEEKVKDFLVRVCAGQFSSRADASKWLGLSPSGVWDILKGRSWTHVTRPAGFAEAVERLLARGSR